MSTLLYRVGKTAYRKPGYFILGWILILGIVISMISMNGIHISSEMKIEGTESQKILDQLATELPAASGGQGSVVFKAPENERLDTPERLAAITKGVNEVYGINEVINPADYAAEASSSTTEATQAASMDQSAAATAPLSYGPLMADGVPVPGVILSADGSIALFQFQFTIEQSAISQDIFDSVIDTVKNVEKDTNITVLPGETLKSVSIGVGSAEIVGLVIAAIVLLVTLGSVVAAGLPLITALLGVGIGVGGAFSISKFIEMPSVTSVLALMIGLAVGIDYALFIVNRQRRMIIDQGLSAQEAAARAIGTSGSAVFFAGLTVIIALCGMLVIGLTFLSTMALVAAATVLINVFVALTLLPALLGLVGERICSPKARKKNKDHHTTGNRGIADRWVKFVIKYRWVTIVAIVVVLGVAATPIAKMEMGIPGAASANLDTVARQSYDAISEGFGEGFNGPLILVAEPKNSSTPVTPELLGNLVKELQAQENVALVTPLGMTKDLAIFSLIPETGPSDITTKNLVNDLRATESGIAQSNDVKLGVTGFTAVNIDMSAKLADVFPIYVGIIILLSLIILLLVFRSIIVPIKATIGFLLSILATFGITTAVFQWGWLHSLFGFDTGGPLLSFMPIIVTGILYGLAMDYQVFLVSSMRESYVHGHEGSESVVHGYNQVSRVVVGAAIIMISVFAGFIFTDDVMIKQIGFTLAVGILIDAFIIRMGLVPAVMSIFGNKAWALPKWLDRILPNLDVEGEKLIATLNAKDKSNSMK
ncbi:MULTISPECIES: MMPL family transporter [unclassified Paenibacillus]|uniref:MMPL family transporter n=1 Tax=unclassified Paenibacillus TaxID=185978 RepID=UPI0024730995|nr:MULTISPECIES: MMPL family transporter [unclassified Paenibacillus]MDH6427091.1 RND superfamily putative drug exporter [Paenibacillus sp. PastH-4]MDH6443120.1 RND superfamily putative drug exporter [Paenibacillus sp. PastF-4]MDH6526174.1 RND superfamily putative drug exporter [Paenibacillus sp. PastH-3]